MSQWIKFDTGTSHKRIAAFKVQNKIVAMTTNVYLMLVDTEFFQLFPNRERSQWEISMAGFLFKDAADAQEAGRYVLNECRKQWGQEVSENLKSV